jgi:type I restriction enzyme M protein
MTSSKRFELGVPPAKNGDFAFLLHLISSLKSTGKGAIILPHGVLFRDKGKVTKGGVKDRLKGVDDDPENDDEREALTRCLELIEAEADAAKAVRDAQASLDAKVLAQYARLSEVEIKRLVVEDKWFASIRAAVEGEVDRLGQRLAGRVQALEERYAWPLPELEAEVEEYSARVEGHLKRMGLVWG